MADIRYYLGIDGGGTKTAFALADQTGTVLKQITLGATNPNDVGFENTFAVLREGIDTLCEGIERQEISVFAGLAGCSSAENLPRIRDFLVGLGFGKTSNHNDAYNAVSAALDGEDGVTVIMGTGSIAYAKSGSYLRRIGGYGYLFGDAGSGFAIGRDVILAALQYEDGSGEQTLLHSLVREKCGTKTVLESIDLFYKEGKQEIARYAPLAFKAYIAGDAVAKKIVADNLSAIARLVRSGADTVGKESVKVALCGGLCGAKEVIIPILSSLLADDKRRYEIEICQKTPVWGALRLAGMPVKQEK